MSIEANIVGTDFEARRELEFNKLLDDARDLCIKNMLAGKVEAFFKQNDSIKNGIYIVRETQREFELEVSKQNFLIYAGSTATALCRNGNAVVRGTRANGNLTVLELTKNGDKVSVKVKDISAKISKAFNLAMQNS